LTLHDISGTMIFAFYLNNAGVAESADAADSKCYASKVVDDSENLDFIGFLTT